MKWYCASCKEWLSDQDHHSCGNKNVVLAEPELIGIVDRLYDMGIMLVSAKKSIMETRKNPLEYRVNLTIDLGRRINEQMFDELPAGWRFLWHTVSADESAVYFLNYHRRLCWLEQECKSIDDFVKERIKEFEAFLDSKDRDAIRTIMLLSDM